MAHKGRERSQKGFAVFTVEKRGEYSAVSLFQFFSGRYTVHGSEEKIKKYCSKFSTNNPFSSCILNFN